MMFTVSPIFDSEFHALASRFAKDAEIENSGVQQTDHKKRFREKKWHETIALGWPACLIASEHGGLGGTVLDFCALLEGTATHAFPLPLSTGMGLPAILLSALSFKNKASLLSMIAEGVVRLQFIPQPLDPFLKQMSHEMTLRIKTIANEIVLDGKVSGVEYIPDATHTLLCCSHQDGYPSLWLIPTAETSPVISHEIRIDSRDSLSLIFNTQPLQEEWCIASGPLFSTAYDRMFNFGALFSCIEAVSSMGTALEQTIRYLSERQQFGVTLSTFQVLRHDLANIYAKYESIRAFVSAFTQKVSDTGEVPERELSLLKIYLSQVGPKLAHTVIQVHGGMGMTEELWATRLNKRILMTSLEYGDGQFHLERAHTLQKTGEQHARS